MIHASKHIYDQSTIIIIIMVIYVILSPAQPMASIVVIRPIGHVASAAILTAGVVGTLHTSRESPTEEVWITAIVFRRQFCSLLQSTANTIQMSQT